MNDVSLYPLRVVSGPDSAVRLPTLLAGLAIGRPFLVVGAQTRVSNSFVGVRDHLEPAPVGEFTEVIGHPPATLIRRAADEAAASRADGIVAVGGGSAADIAKGMSLLLARGGTLDRYVSGSGSDGAPDRLFPLLLVPTTSSGADMTAGGGTVTPDGEKRVFTDPTPAPRVVLLDPKIAAHTPIHVTATTSMNGLAHCFEALYSRVRSPYTDALARHGIRLFGWALPQVVADPTELTARAALQHAAMLGGMVMLNAKLGVHHALCHPIGARYGLAHGDVHSVLLPHCVEFNVEHAADELAAAAADLGFDAEPKAAVQALHALADAAGVPRRLRDLGVPATGLEEAARQVFAHANLDANPRPVRDVDELLAIYESAY